MKLVSTGSFHNAPELGLKDTDGKAMSVIPKGYQFELAPEAKALKGITNKATQELVSKLVIYGWAVVDDGTPESKDAIAKIKAEVSAAAAVDAAAEKNKPLSVADQIALGVANALAAMKK